MYKILPVRRPENHAHLSSPVPYLFDAQMALAEHAKQAMKLVDGEYSRRRIVDRLGQGLDRYIDQDAKCKGGVLFYGALGPEGDRPFNLPSSMALVPPYNRKRGSPTATKSPT